MILQVSPVNANAPAQAPINPLGVLLAALQSGLRLGLSAFALFVAGSFALPGTTLAQSAGPLSPGSAASGTIGKRATPALLAKAPAAPAVSKPSWLELTPMQQQALKPLAASWNTINDGQKRKWIEISRNYPTLAPADQATMHSRMNEWVTLSPQQRAEARLNFAKTKELSTQLTPDEKKAKWQSYQALSPEEKQNLAAKASPKPAGAATAVKPVAPQKLAVVRKNLQAPPAVAVKPQTAPAASAAPAGEMVTPAPQAAP